MSPSELENRLQWWHEKKFKTGAVDVHRTMVKVGEEFGELAKAILKNDRVNAMEEAADIAITLVHIVRHYGGSLYTEMCKKLEVIEERLRTGKKK